MIKKIALSVLAFIVLAGLLLIGYIFLAKVERPDGDVEPISRLRKEEYKNNALEAERWLKSVYELNLFPSFSISVGKQKELVWEGVIGFSDVSKRMLASQYTQYRIGSISKSMTATAVMRMQEKQLLAIDDLFDVYVSDYPAENSGFTIKQLLAHQGGVRHYVNNFSEGYSNKEYVSTRDAASIVENDRLLFPPGEGFHYSTYGYNLVAVAMESSYSKPFEKIMYDEIFTPAGMTATQFDKAEKTTNGNMSTPYLEVGKFFFKAPIVNSSNKYAGGGYLSTPSDMVRFANSLLSNNLITEESREIMWSPVALNTGEMNKENYALGFRVGKDDRGRFVFHGGTSIGGYSFLLIYPDLDIVVAFSTNVSPADSSFDRLQEAKKIARLFVEPL